VASSRRKFFRSKIVALTAVLGWATPGPKT
jgi:hypothetical protein